MLLNCKLYRVLLGGSTTSNIASSLLVSARLTSRAFQRANFAPNFESGGHKVHWAILVDNHYLLLENLCF